MDRGRVAVWPGVLPQFVSSHLYIWEYNIRDSTVLGLIGAGGLARAFIHGVERRKGIVSITGPNDAEAQKLAQRFNVRHVPYHNLYDTLADVVVITDPEISLGHKKGDLNPAFFRSTMTVVDLSAMPEDTELLAESRARGRARREGQRSDRSPRDAGARCRSDHSAARGVGPSRRHGGDAVGADPRGRTPRLPRGCWYRARGRMEDRGSSIRRG